MKKKEVKEDGKTIEIEEEVEVTDNDDDQDAGSQIDTTKTTFKKPKKPKKKAKEEGEEGDDPGDDSDESGPKSQDDAEDFDSDDLPPGYDEGDDDAKPDEGDWVKISYSGAQLKAESKKKIKEYTGYIHERWKDCPEWFKKQHDAKQLAGSLQMRAFAPKNLALLYALARMETLILAILDSEVDDKKFNKEFDKDITGGFRSQKVTEFEMQKPVNQVFISSNLGLEDLKRMTTELKGKESEKFKTVDPAIDEAKFKDDQKERVRVRSIVVDNFLREAYGDDEAIAKEKLKITEFRYISQNGVLIKRCALTKLTKRTLICPIIPHFWSQAK